MFSRRNNNVDVICSILYIKCIIMCNIKCVKFLKKVLFLFSYIIWKKKLWVIYGKKWIFINLWNDLIIYIIIINYIWKYWYL